MRWRWPILITRKLLRLFTFQPPEEQIFELRAGEDINRDGEKERVQTGSDYPAGGNKKFRRAYRKPLKPGKLQEQNRRQEPIITTEGIHISSLLQKDLELIKKVFHLPRNDDVIIREFSLGVNEPVQAAVIYIDGMTDRALQNEFILQPLMLLSSLRLDDSGESLFDRVREKLLPGNQIKTYTDMTPVIDHILNGDTAILISGAEKALVVETKGWERRVVEKPNVEMVVRGPHEAFTETFRVNTALIRKSLHSPDLVTESFKVGDKDRINCAIMYLDGVVNPDLVKEARRRITGIKTDYLGSSGLVEQFIEDHPYALSPQVLSTERPDRVVNHLIEGKVALIVEGSPYALVFPMTLFGILQTAEDAYLRWPYGSLLRILRLLGIFLTAFLPGAYIAVNAYHHEMIPTDLLMAIAGAREQVPFPTVVEVLIMEVSFELIREAGIRIPGIIGPTLGIVGALILGQAAVAAKIVSPILIVIVAVTAIGSFTIPNYTLSLSVRLARFGYILLGTVLGFYGLVLGFFIHLNHLASLKSFGVPFLSPVGQPVKRPDIIIRGPAWEQEGRPGFLGPRQEKKQPRISRAWKRGRGGRGSGAE